MASRQSRSKKQSAGSREQHLSLPEDLVLYLDENLHNCRPILDVLLRHSIKHERHGEHFPSGTEDSVWLPFVGQRGWILLTKDKRIRFNQLEKTAVRRHRVREFYFSSGNFTGAEMAEILVAALPAMIKTVRKQEPPFIASIAKSGQVSLR
jgi:hypothetical protein